MFYVYRFLNSEFEVIYVGRTTSLDSRINSHFSKSGHLPQSCYEETTRVDYIELPSRADMNIVELYFISKYRPAYNTKDNCSDTSVELNELKYAWVKYEKKNKGHQKEGVTKNEKQKYEKDIKRLENELKDVKFRFNHVSREHRVELARSVDYKQQISQLQALVLEATSKVERNNQDLEHVAERTAKLLDSLEAKILKKDDDLEKAIHWANHWKEKYQDLEDEIKKKKSFLRVI
ncbi:GIY-YIG nuclease family protein [Exiguobacterium sp. s22]|uniref:GIY-YIG nuclease family protein n=1 Tax=Exiguobacterium sp. s22 TaxID=2751272 RepID=UPI001BE9BC67|nr:GIY-YIG nuclease family protein [Exiguobacterium sp. s22]